MLVSLVVVVVVGDGGRRWWTRWWKVAEGNHSSPPRPPLLRPLRLAFLAASVLVDEGAAVRDAFAAALALAFAFAALADEPEAMPTATDTGTASVHGMLTAPASSVGAPTNHGLDEDKQAANPGNEAAPARGPHNALSETRSSGGMGARSAIRLAASARTSVHDAAFSPMTAAAAAADDWIGGGVARLTPSPGARDSVSGRFGVRFSHDARSIPPNRSMGVGVGGSAG